MGYASRVGRARTNASNPQAHAICDRCGFRYNFVDLSWQFEWRGATLQNIKILVCNDCLDVPQENIRSIVIPADPTPIVNARVENFAAASSDDLTIVAPPVIDPTTGLPIPSNVALTDQSGNTLERQPIGPNPNLNGDGLTQAAVMPQFGTVSYGVALPVLSMIANGTTFITVTCSAAHGLSTGNNISIQGAAAQSANGFYTVTVTSATAFTYQISSIQPIPAGSLLSGSTRIVTAFVTVPYDYTQIPQTGV